MRLGQGQQTIDGLKKLLKGMTVSFDVMRDFYNRGVFAVDVWNRNLWYSEAEVE